MGGIPGAGGIASSGGATSVGTVTATGGSAGGPGTGGTTTLPGTGGVAGRGGASSTGGIGTGGVTSGGATGAGGTGSGGATAAGTEGGSGASGAGGASGGARRGGACQAGVPYPAPVLTGTPKLLYRPSGTVDSGTYEGPVWVATNSVLLLSDISFTGSINPSQMLKLTPPSTVSTYLADAGVNGMAVGGSGVVFACSHKVQGIVKLDFGTATLTTVVDNVGGKKFNSPNDLVLRSDGTIYFTDPDFQIGNRTSATGKKGIYRVSPSGAASLVDDTFAEPNGITLSPDETVLYVADYNGNAVRTFSVAADGSTSGREDFATVSSPDGFAMDCLGNLYVASGTPGIIQVFAPSGSKLGSVTVASSLSNMAFGGADGKTLYITAGKALYSLEMNLPGYYD
jgi:gluconolactonase